MRAPSTPRARTAQRGLRAALCAFALALALVACGDDDPSGPGTGTGDGGGGMGGGDASDMDAAPPDSGEGDASRMDASDRPDVVRPNPDDDAGEPTCAVDCSALSTECRTYVCNLETLECESEDAADGTECGSQVLDNCTAPDTCQAGVCAGNHAAANTPCGDQNVACRVNDACDGAGRCVDNGFLAVGTTCGSQASSACDAPDSCNAAGECAPNYAAIDAPCGDQDELCHYDDTCDGNGSCVDNGLWLPGSCPPSAPVAADGRCVWGRTLPASQAQQICLPGPDVCDDSGVARLGHEFYAPSGGTTDGTACGNASPSHPQCDAADSCSAGVCVTNSAPALTPCGDQATNTTCDRPDSCDGFGNCEPRYADGNTVCAEPAGECFLEARCNGSGSCGQASAAPMGTACGDPSDAECDGPDVCDALGNCTDGFDALGTVCGAPVNGVCDAPDECNGAGTCVALFADTSTVCGDADVECMLPDTCDGSGGCEDNGPQPFGEPCGDMSSTECSGPDVCDGSGACSPNDEPEGTSCGGSPGTCEAQDSCGTDGTCVDRGALPSCDLDVLIRVRDRLSAAPLANVTVELAGSDPLRSAVTDENGDATLSIPADESVWLRALPSATHWGVVRHERVAPGDTPEPLLLIANEVVQPLVSAPGLDPVDDAGGIVATNFADASGDGGESASVTPPCTPSECGPVVIDGMGAASIGDELLAGGAQDVIFINQAPGSASIAVAGNGVNACAIDDEPSTVLVYARTLTQVQARCTVP